MSWDLAPARVTGQQGTAARSRPSPRTGGETAAGPGDAQDRPLRGTTAPVSPGAAARGAAELGRTYGGSEDFLSTVKIPASRYGSVTESVRPLAPRAAHPPRCTDELPLTAQPLRTWPARLPGSGRSSGATPRCRSLSTDAALTSVLTQGPAVAARPSGRHHGALRRPCAFRARRARSCARPPLSSAARGYFSPPSADVPAAASTSPPSCRGPLRPAPVGTGSTGSRSAPNASAGTAGRAAAPAPGVVRRALGRTRVLLALVRPDDIARSAWAVIVSDGLTPRFAETAEPSTTEMPGWPYSRWYGSMTPLVRVRADRAAAEEVRGERGAHQLADVGARRSR